MPLPANPMVRRLIGTVFAAWLVASVIALLLGQSVAVVAPAALGLLLVLASILAASAFNEHRRLQDYRQMEAYVSLVAALQPVHPLPTMRHWAASPDVLKEIAELVLEGSPKLVVEASSGTSTVIIALCLRKLGNGGRVLALEHDAVFAERTRRALRAQGLSDIATVTHAPLKPYLIGTTTYHWYDLDELTLDVPINLLVVDGPPGSVQRMARYPAVPLLVDQLAPDAVVVVDDGARSDERRMVQEWTQSHAMQAEYLHLDKGAYVLRRLPKGGS